MKDIVCISDLHLMPERPQTMELFIRFVDDIASKADTLYILGDFLEVWWGDDDPATGYADVFNSLTELTSKHKTKVYLMHGNRDFMIGQSLADRCHFEIIQDPHKIIINGKDALLMHGDTLCTDDVEYQKFRQMVRNPLWQQQALSKTLEERFQLAKSIRESSKQSTTEKDEYIMDVNQQETDKAFIDNHVDLIIHGHTHRPAIHHKKVNGRNTTRVVLGDWFEKGSYLRVNDSSELKLQSFK
ncbi:MAG: UDP-2,3-diacylglucosamine diphosphatase [Gammaproteobacteria bacterium]|jgi:UDP-2,3-diacylglucosamine hydrolase|nr:UDP-2,3-diacylglucosamine diphosphatase [Gammaproteobacteria bacterium]